MAERRKFGALAGIRQQQPAEGIASVIDEAPQANAQEVGSRELLQNPSAKGKGRPPGKRSDPEFQPTTVFLKKKTKKAAARKLEDGDTGQDLSDLIEHLLDKWLHA